MVKLTGPVIVYKGVWAQELEEDTAERIVVCQSVETFQNSLLVMTNCKLVLDVDDILWSTESNTKVLKI